MNITHDNDLTTGGANTNSCDRCGRSGANFDYLYVSGVRICGICQWEVSTRPNIQHIKLKDESKK